MTFTVTYPASGRGAFPVSGLGGTLNVEGTGPGPYYRAPAAGSTVKMPGLIAAQASRANVPCSINDYAVNRAVRALQVRFSADPDGILGPNTNAAIRSYQKAHDLAVDGVVGPATCQSLFRPLVVDALQTGTHTAQIQRAVWGHIGFESNWDHGAVGFVTPEDLGLGQINGPSHPGMTANARLDPVTAVPWVVQFVNGNFAIMSYDEDAAILAYNLGIGGAYSWIRAGRPQMFYKTDAWAYIAKIKQLGI